MSKRIKVLIALGLMFLGFLFYPQINEDADSNCAALEKRALRVMSTSADESLVMIFLKGLSNGAVSADAAKEAYPHVPPALGCAIGYFFGGFQFDEES
tara:strand:- start:369 stop:662 length:294 start_codon:yes stop_codon:yes gene_type:complete